jgi:DNA-binding NarL/FixJ family response regulator
MNPSAPGVRVIDDDMMARDVFTENLRDRFPYLIIEVTANGNEALELINLNRPELVFLDIELAGMNGLRAVQKIKSEFPDVKVAMLTSCDVPEYRHAAEALGAERFLVKDQFQWDEVETLVASLASKGAKKR